MAHCQHMIGWNIMLCHVSGTWYVPISADRMEYHIMQCVWDMLWPYIIVISCYAMYLVHNITHCQCNVIGCYILLCCVSGTCYGPNVSVI